MRFIVTGPTSKLGRIFVARLLELENEVFVLHYVDPQIPGTRWRYWQLGEPLPHDLGAIEIIIHCAFDRSSLFAKSNHYLDSLAVLKLVQTLNKKQRLFLPASYSAAENALSYYGQSKFLQQEIVRISGQNNFFVGYLGGTYKKPIFQLKYFILSILPFVFVPLEQQMTVVVTKIDTVRDFVDQLARSSYLSEIELESRVMAFRAFLRESGFRGVFISIPDGAFIKSLQFLRVLNLPFVSPAADSLLSLMHQA
jgi:hypothetical protein